MKFFRNMIFFSAVCVAMPAAVFAQDSDKVNSEYDKKEYVFVFAKNKNLLIKGVPLLSQMLA